MSSDAPEKKEKVFAAAKGLKSPPKILSRPHVHKYDIHNIQFSKEDAAFLAACTKAGIKPCARQASKWRNKKGLAYANR